MSAVDGEPMTAPYAEPACQAPSVLPPPGAEQPADPAASRTAIEQAWAQAMTPGADPSVGEGAVDDPRGVEDARREVVEGSLPDDVLESVRVTVDAIVFADPSTAWVRYSVVIGAYGPSSALGDRFGEARFVDGRWKVTRRTVCELLAQGGGTCAPVG